MGSLLLYGAKLFTPHRTIDGGALLVEGRRIAAVGSLDEVTAALGAGDVDERIDLKGRLLAPGLVDLQVNGAGGRFLTEESAEGAVGVVATTLARHGCTAFLPTVISAPIPTMLGALREVAGAMRSPPPGARVLGAHLEGPFLNPERAGAHRRDFLRPPSVEEFRRFWEESEGSIRLLTLAPELPGAEEVIQEARGHGVTVAIGHSDADYAQMVEAHGAGARFVTHLFNAMRPLTGREPGTVGAALALDGLSASIIADGVHVHPAALELAVRAKGARGLVLVTDAMPPAGTELSEFQIDGEKFSVRGGACFNPQGVRVGSVLTMERAVANMHRLAHVPLPEAFAMASANPAAVVAVDRAKGSLEAGKDADLMVCDADLTVRMTVVEGETVFRSPDL